MAKRKLTKTVHAGQFRAVVADDREQPPASEGDAIQFAGDADVNRTGCRPMCAYTARARAVPPLADIP